LETTFYSIIFAVVIMNELSNTGFKPARSLD